MTATKRKTPNEKQANEPTTKPGTSGVKYHCDGCSADISNTVRIRCAHRQNITNNVAGQTLTQSVLICDNFDLCGQCFCEGKEVGQHKAWHDYRVIEPHSIPIFTEDWGADEELLLIEACQIYGLGNWSDIADHVGNGRTKEEIERHYLDVFIGSEDYPLPPIDARIEIDQDEFQARKKRRLEDVLARPLHAPPPKPVSSVPANHEIAGFMPGRLDFENEWENEAENSIKDMSFGGVYRFGGDSQPEKSVEEEALACKEAQGPVQDDRKERNTCTDADSAAKRKRGMGSGAGKIVHRSEEQPSKNSDTTRDHSSNEVNDDSIEANRGHSTGSPALHTLQLAQPPDPKPKAKEKDKQDSEQSDEEADEEPPLSDENDLDLELKLTILDIYNDKYDRRLQAKAVVFDRNLLDYKKIQAAERKLPKEIRDLVIRIKPFARLQTATDHEKFQEGLIYEMALRKRVAELQEYRKMGITTLADAERYEKEKSVRLLVKQREIAGFERFGSRKQRASGAGLGLDETTAGSREGTPGSSGKGYKKNHSTHLSLSTSSSKQLLHPSELALCSRLKILPKPFLVIKETMFREHVRRVALGMKLDRSEMVILFPSSGLVDEDVLEIDEPIGRMGEGQDEICNGIHELVRDHQPRSSTSKNDQSHGKQHKVEVIWDFYFSGYTPGTDLHRSAAETHNVTQQPNHRSEKHSAKSKDSTVRLS